MTTEIEKIIDEPEKKRFNPKYDLEDLKKAFALGHKKALDSVEKEIDKSKIGNTTEVILSGTAHNQLLKELKQRLEKLRGSK